MKHSQVLNRLERLLKISSPSKKEKNVAHEIMHQLEEIGLEVTYDKAHENFSGEFGNILAFVKEKDPRKKPITFNAHMDTVETADPPKYEIDYDKIRSAGELAIGLDDKIGIAVTIEAASIIKQQVPDHGRINLLFTVSEEIGLLGAKNFNYGKIEGSFVYVVDSHGKPGIIINQAPSQVSLDFSITGKAAHSGVEPEKGASAIVAASKAIAGMKLGRIDKFTTANIGVIKGGLARNIVPPSVKVQAEARSHNEQNLREQVEHMIKCFSDAAAHEGCLINYDKVVEYTSFFWDEDQEIVVKAKNAILKSGLLPVVDFTGGGSDTNVFNKYGIPAIALSCGYHNPHTSQEYAYISDIEKSVEILVNLASE